MRPPAEAFDDERLADERPRLAVALDSLPPLDDVRLRLLRRLDVPRSLATDMLTSLSSLPA